MVTSSQNIRAGAGDDAGRMFAGLRVRLRDDRLFRLRQPLGQWTSRTGSPRQFDPKAALLQRVHEPHVILERKRAALARMIAVWVIQHMADVHGSVPGLEPLSAPARTLRFTA